MAQSHCAIAVDIGGTFTDIVLEATSGLLSTKELTDHTAPELSVLRGVARLLAEARVHGSAVTRFVHGTTLATNAIIERRGARTALVTTRGFRDALEIAYEHRFDQYDLFMQRPAALVPRHLRFEVGERCTAAGAILATPAESEWSELAATLRALQVTSVAVGFLHSFANPHNEIAAAQALARDLPEASVCLSHQVCPEIREYERLCTTVANAYVRPIISGYLRRLQEALASQLTSHAPLLLMTSAGGLASVETARRFPVRLVESGPAGGVIFARRVAEHVGARQVVAFDMGGTTAKLCLIDDGRPQTSRLFEIDRAHRFRKGSGIPVRIPVIELVEIGAGGGSIASVDAMGRITIGPESAGSEPGPVCYGRGGERPTVTDADLLLGRIDPATFGDGAMALETAPAARAIQRALAGPLNLSGQAAALGISEMVDETMASAVRIHAIEQGKAVHDRVLIAIGGAGPLHGARLAQKLGIRQVVVPRDAGVGSAVGFLHTPVAFHCARSLYQRLSRFDAAAINALIDKLVEEARGIVAEAQPRGEMHWTLRADARYLGQGHEVSIELPMHALQDSDAPKLRRAFEETYERLYGRIFDDHDIEFLNWMVDLNEQATSPAGNAGNDTTMVAAAAGSATGSDSRRMIDPGANGEVEACVRRRDSLISGETLDGPALIVETQTTTVVPTGFQVCLEPRGHLVLTRKGVR
ncbi:MAG: hydantoinase/oxoprolinase family protein [Gammaproteobacteria bacterium]|nr:hydantoinase/oxoprolinase family protein [Gammaproteobacteria bacterium]